MKYSVRLKPRAEKDLKKIQRSEAKRIYEALKSLEEGYDGKVKKLTDHTPEFRMRVGPWRILLEIEDTEIIVYRIRDRKDAYR